MLLNGVAENITHENNIEPSLNQHINTWCAIYIIFKSVCLFEAILKLPILVLSMGMFLFMQCDFLKTTA